MSLTFYGIREGVNEDIAKRIELLKSACAQRGIEYVDLDALTADLTKLPNLDSSCLLYNISRGALNLESQLLNEKVTTFYKTNPTIAFNQDTTKWIFAHTKAKLPQPKTIHQITADRELLKNYADYVGGFPLIVKTAGGTRGTGVMKIDSFSSLISVMDYLAEQKAEGIIRQYIEAESIVRIMVLGNRAIACLQYQNLPNDFRTNAGKNLVYKLTDCSEEVKQTAVESVHSTGVEFGGVDIIFDNQGNHYLLEMNFPTGFVSLPKLGIDIAGLMLDYLIAKRKKGDVKEN